MTREELNKAEGALNLCGAVVREALLPLFRAVKAQQAEIARLRRVTQQAKQGANAAIRRIRKLEDGE